MRAYHAETLYSPVLLPGAYVRDCVCMSACSTGVNKACTVSRRLRSHHITPIRVYAYEFVRQLARLHPPEND